MPAILIGLITALINGGSIGAALGALTGADWLTLAIGVASELEPTVAAKLGLAHPSLGALVESVAAGVGPELASKAAQAWFTANATAAIERQPGIAGE